MPELAGEISSSEAWEILSSDTAAQLVDVRTSAEWAYVGVCDLSSIGKEAIRVEWQTFPDLSVNPDFCEEIEKAGLSRDARLLFICRSGVRSKSAAMAIAQRGYENCYNIIDGFEGDRDNDRHRGSLEGWKVSGLPWIQQ